jgi:hypothetical protein
MPPRHVLPACPGERSLQAPEQIQAHTAVRASSPNERSDRTDAAQLVRRGDAGAGKHRA